MGQSNHNNKLNTNFAKFQIFRCQPGTSWNGMQCDCQTGWTRFGNSCYQRFDAGKNFADAEADCESKKSTLVVISSADEYSFIKNLRTTGQSVYVWNLFLAIKKFRQWDC